MGSWCNCCIRSVRVLSAESATEWIPIANGSRKNSGIYTYLRALSLLTRLRTRTLKKAGAGRHVSGYGITARWDFNSLLITRFVYKYRIPTSSDTASNTSTLGISNPDPLPERNNTYPYLLELRRRSDFILFYFKLWRVFAILRKIFWTKNILYQTPCSFGKSISGKNEKFTESNRQKSPQLPRIWKGA